MNDSSLHFKEALSHIQRSLGKASHFFLLISKARNSSITTFLRSQGKLPGGLA